MNYILLFWSFILVLVLTSCSTRKKVLQKDHRLVIHDTFIKKDSIYVVKEKISILPSVNTDIIANPCDSTGRLQVFKKVIPFPFGRVELTSENNNILAKVNTDSINSVFQKQYEERHKKQIDRISELEKVNQTLKNTPFNWWKIGCLASLFLHLIAIFYLVKNNPFR